MSTDPISPCRADRFGPPPCRATCRAMIGSPVAVAAGLPRMDAGLDALVGLAAAEEAT